MSEEHQNRKGKNGSKMNSASEDSAIRNPQSAFEDSAFEEAPLLSIENLIVGFGGSPVLRDINLRIHRGETLAVIGESGCGKTVLLKSIVGLIPIWNGKVIFENHSIYELSEKRLTKERLRFGFVFQQAALFDSLSVFENIAFALREHTTKTESQIRGAVYERLGEVGLSTDILFLKPAELSGGMRKRVGLARAISLDPEVMLYDEPTTGLDPIMSDVINELILRTRKRRPVTSIMVTHDMKSAQKVADRIVMIYPISRLVSGQSQIIYDGPSQRIEESDDPRVTQFVHGEARERLTELERAVQQGNRR